MGGRARSAPRPAYTVETLTELRAEYGEAAELWLLIGGDSLALPGWRHWQQILPWPIWRVAAPRPAHPTPLPPELAAPLAGGKWLIFKTERSTVQSAPRTLPRPRRFPPRPSANAGRRPACRRAIGPAVVDYINQQHFVRPLSVTSTRDRGSHTQSGEQNSAQRSWLGDSCRQAKRQESL